MDIQSEKLALIKRLAQYNQEIEEAEAAIDQGEYYTLEEVESMTKRW